MPSQLAVYVIAPTFIFDNEPVKFAKVNLYFFSVNHKFIQF